MIQHVRQLEIDNPVMALAVSADGTLIAVASENHVELIAVESGETTCRLDTESAATGLALSTDNRWLAIATGAPTVTVCDAGSGEVVHQHVRRNVPDFLRIQSQVQVAFFPGATTLATRAENSDVTVWNCEIGGWDYLYRMPHRKGELAMSPTGKQIAILSEPNPDAYSGQVTVYRLHQGLQFAWNERHDSKQGVRCAAFSPSGSQLATWVADDAIRFWDVESGRRLEHLAGPKPDILAGIAFVGDERHLLTIGTQALEIRKIGNDSLMASVPTQNKILGSGASADGRLLATFGEDSALDVWRVESLIQSQDR